MKNKTVVSVNFLESILENLETLYDIGNFYGFTTESKKKVKKNIKRCKVYIDKMKGDKMEGLWNLKKRN